MEINSMTAFSRIEGMNDYVIGGVIFIIINNTLGLRFSSSPVNLNFIFFLSGIAIYKQPGDDVHVHHHQRYGQFLNIYFDHERPGQLSSLISSCVTVELEFLPYMLTHAEVPLFVPKMSYLSETVFLLTGSDHRVHMYLEDKERHTFVEVITYFLLPIHKRWDLACINLWHYFQSDLTDVFPEFVSPRNSFPSPPLWIDTMYLNPEKSRRISALGLECGGLHIRWVSEFC